MLTKKSSLWICIAIPLIVGGIAGFLTRGMEAFASLNKPPLSPPGWLFPVVWTILYILMGIASYLILVSDAKQKEISKALTIYGAQLAVNFFWPIFFFNDQMYFFSLLWIILLWILIVIMHHLFNKISKWAAYLIVPYLLWVTFATYLNAGIWWLN